MNFFLKKIRKFSLIIITIVIGSYLANYFLISSFKLQDRNMSLVFMGDSNVETSIDDSLIDNSINLAASGDSYLYTYIKLRKLIRDHKDQIDTVLVSFSPHNVFENDKIFSKSKIFSSYRIHYPMMEQNEINLLFNISSKSIIYSILSLPVEFFKNCFKILNHEPVFFGKYVEINKKQVYKFVKNLNENKITKLKNYSDIEINYLNKIIDLVENECKTIILINTPKRIEILKHRSYQVNKYRQLYDSIYSHISLVDLSEFELDINDFGDLIHLNKNGAQKISNHIKEVGLKNLIEKNH